MERQPVRRFRPDPGAPRPPDDVWPLTVPAIAQVLREGLALGPGATVLVGENGSGKSTVLLGSRGTSAGFYLLDEPDAALSFTGTLSLVVQLGGLAAAGAQVMIATHSPVLAALPGARILEVGEWGLREAEWNDLELIASWRQFLGDPQSFLRHLR